MMNAYKQGKDLYATIAKGVYHNNYEDNLECYPDGSLNPEGKARRSNCKSLLLGIMYGRGVASIAEQIEGTIEQAQEIIDNFYKAFPKVKSWIQESEELGKQNGYVTDLWGRRRRLPDLLLPKYTVKFKKETKKSEFNPFLDNIPDPNRNSVIAKYLDRVNNVRGAKELKDLKVKAAMEGVDIINNGGFISQAQRQCVNARIQGSAATMTKKAMIKIYNDKELKDLDFRLLIGVHDELIGECPEIYVDRVSELLTEDMKTSAKDKVSVPFKCDADISYNWYWSDYGANVKKEYDGYIKGDAKKGIAPLTEEEAFRKICEEHSELTKENLNEITCLDLSGFDLEDDDEEVELELD